MRHDKAVETPLAGRNLSLGFFMPAFAAMLGVMILLSPVPLELGSRVLLAVAALALASLLGDALCFHFSLLRRVVRPLLALVLLYAAYSLLGWVTPWVAPEDQEWTLLAVDRQGLGYTWEGWWGSLQHPWWTDVLQVVYASFYFFPLFFLAWLIYRRDVLAQDSYMNRLVLGFLLSYCGYLCVSARSPYEFLEYAAILPSFGLRDLLHGTLTENAMTRRDCFPSGHTMMACYVAWLGWQRAPRSLLVFGPWAALTVLATLYLRYHYLVDVLVGLLYFGLWVVVSEWLFGRFREIPGPEPLESGA